MTLDPAGLSLRQGDIYVVNFDPTRGSEQGGRRPAVIVSNNAANSRGKVVTVAPLTRTIPRRTYPQNVHLDEGDPLADEGTIYCGQVLTVSKERLGNYLARLPPAKLDEVKAALSAWFDLS